MILSEPMVMMLRENINLRLTACKSALYFFVTNFYRQRVDCVRNRSEHWREVPIKLACSVLCGWSREVNTTWIEIAQDIRV